MKLPLAVQFDHYGHPMVTDASYNIVCTLKKTERKFAEDLVYKMNQHWRWRLFGQQPYEYTRDDWLYGGSTKC